MRCQSQTQSGRRYTPQLTRFYTAIGPGILVDLLKESLDVLGVKHKDAHVIAGSKAVHRLRVGGYDKRKIMFKGWIELEVFSRMQVSGAFCVMQRDVVRRRVQVAPYLRLIRFLSSGIGQSGLLETVLEGVDSFAGNVSSCLAKVR